MNTAPSQPARLRERLLPALLLGAAAGLIGTLALILFNPQQTIAGTAAIYGGFSFVAALVAIQFAPANFLEVSGLICAGIAVGVFLSVLVHPMVGGAERNLWPLEIPFFCIVGAGPMWLGLVLGRFLNSRRHRGTDDAV
jgi:hypothetical protein